MLTVVLIISLLFGFLGGQLLALALFDRDWKLGLGGILVMLVGMSSGFWLPAILT